MCHVSVSPSVGQHLPRNPLPLKRNTRDTLTLPLLDGRDPLSHTFKRWAWRWRTQMVQQRCFPYNSGAGAVVTYLSVHPWKHENCKYFTQWQRPCCIISLLRITNYSQSSSHKSFRIQNILSKSQKCFKTWHITKFYLGSFEIEIWNGIWCCQKRFVQCSCVSQDHVPVKMRNCTGCSHWASIHCEVWVCFLSP